MFQDRFKSETVEDDRYLLVVLRYIHQNPLKAVLAKDIGEYEWVSYSAYLNKQSNLVDRYFILNLFYSDRIKAEEQFRIFMQEANEDSCLDDESKKHWSEQEVHKILHNFTNQDNLKNLFSCNQKFRDKIFLKIREKGVTIRQLSEVNGLGRGVIERVTRSKK